LTFLFIVHTAIKMLLNQREKFNNLLFRVAFIFLR